MKHVLNDPALKHRRQELRRNQTDAERKLWGLLRNRQFHDFKVFRQYSVGPYILDFYVPALKLAIELDGGHHDLAEYRQHDTLRSDFLSRQGLRLIRFWNSDVLRDPQSVMARLEEIAGIS